MKTVVVKNIVVFYSFTDCFFLKFFVKKKFPLQYTSVIYILFIWKYFKSLIESNPKKVAVNPIYFCSKQTFLMITTQRFSYPLRNLRKIFVSDEYFCQSRFPKTPSQYIITHYQELKYNYTASYNAPLIQTICRNFPAQNINPRQCRVVVSRLTALVPCSL